MQKIPAYVQRSVHDVSLCCCRGQLDKECHWRASTCVSEDHRTVEEARTTEQLEKPRRKRWHHWEWMHMSLLSTGWLNSAGLQTRDCYCWRGVIHLRCSNSLCERNRQACKHARGVSDCAEHTFSRKMSSSESLHAMPKSKSCLVVLTDTLTFDVNTIRITGHHVRLKRHLWSPSLYLCFGSWMWRVLAIPSSLLQGICRIFCPAHRVHSEWSHCRQLRQCAYNEYLDSYPRFAPNEATLATNRRLYMSGMLRESTEWDG